MNQYLSRDQIEELVSNNLYDYEGNPFKSRCFSGIYQKDVNLPALSLPGGDIGELAILFSAAENYGFKLNISKISKIFSKLIGKSLNSTFNSIQEHSITECRYLHYLLQQSEGYELSGTAKESFLATAVKFGLSQPNLAIDKTYKVKEQACIILEAQKGLFPQFTFETSNGSFETSVFVIQKTLVDKRHRELSRLLVENIAVKLYKGLDADYLYEVLSEMTDIHLLQTMTLIGSAIPIYSVIVDSKGKISVEKVS